MNYCTRCGEALSPGTAHCPRCGKNVRTAEHPAESWQTLVMLLRFLTRFALVGLSIGAALSAAGAAAMASYLLYQGLSGGIPQLPFFLVAPLANLAPMTMGIGMLLLALALSGVVVGFHHINTRLKGPFM